MISYYHNEPWVAHTLKVFGYAQGIAAGENLSGEELEALEYAALFHDVGIPEGLAREGTAAGPVQERWARRSPCALPRPTSPARRCSSASAISWGTTTPSASAASAICRSS